MFAVDDKLRSHFVPVLAAVRAAAMPQQLPQHAPPATRRFVTISRQTGAGGVTLGEGLARRMNELFPRGPAWTCWERELVEKVARDHHLSRQVIEAMEESHPTWLSDLFSGLSIGSGADDFAVYQRVAATIRALAHGGNVAIVGRGGVFITRKLPGGVHLRLVAPLQYRIEQIAQRLQLSGRKAAAYVERADEARAAFYRFYWPQEPLAAESFTMTLNTAAIGEQQLVDCVVPLLKHEVAHG